MELAKRLAIALASLVAEGCSCRSTSHREGESATIPRWGYSFFVTVDQEKLLTTPP